MAVDAAMAGGIGQGLLQGIQTFLQTQNMLQDQAIKKRLANAQTMDAAAKIYDLGGINPSTQGLVSSYSQGDFSPQGGQGLVPYQRVYPMQQVPSQVPNQPAQTPSQSQPGMSPAQSPSQTGPSNPQGLLDQTGNDVGFNYDPMKGGTIPGMGQVGPLSTLDQRTRTAVAQIYAKNMENYTPQGMIALQKAQADLDNAKNEQFNKGAESFKSTKDTFSTAADAYGKLIKVSDEDSPKNRQSALMQVIKLDMPRQAVRYNTIQAMEDDPQIAERWGNYFSRIKTGSPSQISINDIKTLGTNLYQANSDEFRAAQQDERANAKTRHVSNPNYVDLSYADKMDKLAKNSKKNTPKYQAPTASTFVDQAAPPEIAGLINKMGGGLYAGAKGLMNNLTPSSFQGPSTAGDSTHPVPPSGLSFQQFKAWKRSNGQ